MLAAGDSYSAGATGGEATHVLTTAETPAHTHTRGTMNITGSHATDRYSGWGTSAINGIGAFAGSNSKTATTLLDDGTNNSYACFVADFDASRSWTGETSSVGGSTAHNNMPPYLVVYCWYRIN